MQNVCVIRIWYLFGKKLSFRLAKIAISATHISIHNKAM